MKAENIPAQTGISWNERLWYAYAGEPLAHAICGAYSKFQLIELAIEQRALDLQSRAKAERSSARKEIVRRHQAINGSRATVETSRRILYVRARLPSLELTWKEVVYPEAKTRGAASRRWLKDVGSTRKSGVDLRHVVSGAHPDEVDLLVRHEMEAREIRRLWRQAKKSQVQLATLGRRVLKLLDEATGTDNFASDSDE